MLYEKYKGRGFTVLAVSMDAAGKSVVAPYKKMVGLTFPHLLDSRNDVSFQYRVRGTPTNYFLDRKGQVVTGVIGYRDLGSPAAVSLIEALLAEPAGPKGKKKAQASGAPSRR